MLSPIYAICLAILLPAVTHGLKVERSQNFPLSFEIENVALRPSGAALALSYASEAHIFEVPIRANATPKVIYTFQNATGVASITASPLKEDEYIVITGNFSFLTIAPAPGSYAIHRLTFPPHSATPIVEFLAPLTALSQPNGLIAVPGTPSVLIADSRDGIVWRFNTKTLKLEQYFDHPLLKPLASSAPILFGVNGIKLTRGYFYFSNSNQEIVARLPGTGCETPGLSGTPEIVVTETPIDDFIVNECNGDLYLAQNFVNSLGFRAAKSNSTVPTILLGGVNSTELQEPSAVIWAKGEEGRKLIVTSSGPVEQFETQNFTEGGRLTFIELDS